MADLRLPDQSKSPTPPRKSDGSNAPGDPKQSEKRARAMMGVAVVVLGMLAFIQLTATTRTPPQIRYDEFKSRLRNGEIEEVWIGSDRIAGRARRAPANATPAQPQHAQPQQPGSAPVVVPPATRLTPLPRSSGPGPDFETIRIGDDKELIPLLEAQHVRMSGVPERGGTWWFLLSAAPIVLLVLAWRSMMKRASAQQSSVLAFGKSKGKVAGESEIKVRFDDVAGVEEAKEELREIVEFLRSPEKFTRLGAKIPKGVLLVGPPGTGKTLLARAVAGEAGVPFFSISGSEFVEMFVGVGAARVRDMFEQAQQHAPCIVFIDELDALGRSRGANIVGTNEEREQTLNQLLVEMDGFAVNKGVIIMAATNRPEILDPALLRPGRFDRQVLVDRPDRRGREAILKVHAREVRLDPDVDLADIAARTPGFAGADLANIINEAALLAARRNRQSVKREDLIEAIDRVVAGLEKKSRLITPEERVRVAYHESGHAIVGEVLPGAEKTAKISIVPRGVAALGYTMHLPTEDRYIMTEGELKARLAAMLGGRAAEKIIFGDLSTGASNDLAQATELAREMVTQFGMSDRIGPVTLARTRRPAFLPHDVTPMDTREHGDRFANAIDEEVRRIVEDAERRALETLGLRRAVLEHLAKMLIEKEYIDGDDLRRLLDEARRPTGEPAQPTPGPNGGGAMPRGEAPRDSGDASTRVTRH
jgi:cell division protease FtsH